MPNTKDTLYEYKTMRNPNSYVFRELSLPGHKFSYIKRRDLKRSTKFTAFKPVCSCKHKFEVWMTSKDNALAIFNEHIKMVKAMYPNGNLLESGYPEGLA